MTGPAKPVIYTLARDMSLMTCGRRVIYTPMAAPVVTLAMRVTVRRLLCCAKAAVLDANEILDDIDPTPRPVHWLGEAECALAAFVAEHFFFEHPRCISLALEAVTGIKRVKWPTYTCAQRSAMFRTIGKKLFRRFRHRDWHVIALDQAATAYQNTRETSDADIAAEIARTSPESALPYVYMAALTADQTVCFPLRVPAVGGVQPHVRVALLLFALHVAISMFGVAFDVAAAGLRTQLHNLKTDGGSMADVIDGLDDVARRDYSLLLSLSHTAPLWLSAALEQRRLCIFNRATFGTK